MTFSLRAALCGLLLLAAPAAAEQNNNGQFQFAANFPCQSQLMPQSLDTEVGKVTMNLFICETGNGGAFGVSIADYPPGTITDDNRETRFAGAAQGSATNVQGVVRNMVPFTLGRYTGKDYIVDSTAMGMTVRSRIFFVGDRLYQVLAIGVLGSENSSDVVAFLNSFRITK